METLTNLLNVTKHGDRLALAVTQKGAKLTYKQLSDEIDKTVLKLLSLGLKPSEAVAIVIPNSIEFVICYIACTLARCVACPLNSAYKTDEFDFYLSDASVKLMIVPESGNEAAEKAAAALNIPIVSVLCDTKGVTTMTNKIGTFSSEPTKRSEPLPDDNAMFLHTSGTTSKPKCVPLTHHNLMASLHHIEQWYELSSSDTTLLVMPLFHVHGLMGACLSTLLSGGTVVIPKEGKFSASLFWDQIREYECTWYSAVPTIHQILLARADVNTGDEAKADSAKASVSTSAVTDSTSTSSSTTTTTSYPPLRFIRSCSASLAPTVLALLENTFHTVVLEAYAMTEAAHQMTSNPLPKYGKHKAGSVGIPTGIELCILNEKCEKMEKMKTGEVCIKGENVTKGYLNRPEANVEAFAGGWFHTGDQGYLDEEGYLVLTGRIKELINRGGEKISPLEIDGVLLAHSCVSEAVCFGVPHSMYGEEVEAVVVLKEGKTATAEEIIEFCKERLALFKVPKRVHISKDMPRTATGKIQRRIISAHFMKK